MTMLVRPAAAIEEICEVTGLEPEMFNLAAGVDWEGFVARARSLARTRVRQGVGDLYGTSDPDVAALVREAEIWLTASRLAWRARLRLILGRGPALMAGNPEQLKQLTVDLDTFANMVITQALNPKPTGRVTARSVQYTPSEPFFTVEDEW